MAFAALDDEFFGHPKTTTAGNEGAGVYARALSYCAHYLTDGFVPLAWVKEIARPVLRRKITEAGFWVEVEGGEHYEYISGAESYAVDVLEPGYFIPDYLTYNPTRAAVLAKRDELSRKRSEAGKKGALVRWQRDGKTGGKRVANVVASAWPPAPSPESFLQAVTEASSEERPDSRFQIPDKARGAA